MACRLADLFEERGISYALGGSLALGFYAEPRGTIDVDMNVFVAVDRELDRLLAMLKTVGFVPDGPLSAIRRQAEEDAQFRGYVGGVRVDIFVPSISYYAELAERRRRVVFVGRPIWILGAEDLVVLKMMFFRLKVPHSRRLRLRLWPGPAPRPWNNPSRSLALPGGVCSMEGLADVEAVVRNMGGSLDRGFVFGKLAELAGADDSRIEQFQAILDDVEGNPSS